MKRIMQKVAAIMQSHEHHPLLSLATVLHAGSLLYDKIIRKRQTLFDKGRLPVAKLPCPVISIGNITVGGTGKTPMALHLSRLLDDLGYKTVVISRGYKGAGERHGMVVSDGDRIFCDAHQSGDEPLLIARLLRGVPVVVGRNRHAAGLMAIERFDPDVLLLDDGFQHQQLARDLNILLLDARASFGNSFLLPRGNLREPVSAVKRADVVVFTRCKDRPAPASHQIEEMMASPSVFRSVHRPVFRGVVPAGENLSTFPWSLSDGEHPSILAGKRVVAFSGLARNRQFWRTICVLGGRLAGTVGFEDHHPYQSRDIQRICRTARSVDCDTLVTTDKDLVRLPSESALPLDLVVLGVDMDFTTEDKRWRKMIAHRLCEISDKFVV